MRMSKDMLGTLQAEIVKKAAPKSAPVAPVTPAPAAPPVSYRFQVTRGDDGKIKEITAVALTDKPNA